MLAIMGIGALIAAVGGALYILIVVGSLLWGKRLDAGRYGTERTVLKMPVAAAITGHGHAAGFAAPGTFVFALVFLTAFVLYYFVNWKYLSTVRGLS